MSEGTLTVDAQDNFGQVQSIVLIPGDEVTIDDVAYRVRDWSLQSRRVDLIDTSSAGVVSHVLGMRRSAVLTLVFEEVPSNG